MNDSLKTDIKDTLIETIKITPSIQIVCKQTGVSRATYYRWLKKDKDFADKVNEALKDGIFNYNAKAESTILTGVEKGQLTATIFWLKKRHPEYMYRSNPISEIQGYNIKPINEETLDQTI